MNKTRIIVFLSIIIGVFLTGCFPTETDDNEIVSTIQIRIMDSLSDQEFRHLRIRETGSTGWAITLRFEHSVGTHNIQLTPTLEIDKDYEIQLETNDQRTATIVTSLTQNSIVAFERRHFDDDTALDITAINIRNLTGYTFRYIQIRRTGVESWLYSRRAIFRDDETYPLQNINPPLRTNIRYDIMLREHATGGLSAMRRNIYLTQNGTVTFLDLE